MEMQLTLLYMYREILCECAARMAYKGMEKEESEREWERERYKASPEESQRESCPHFFRRTLHFWNKFNFALIACSSFIILDPVGVYLVFYSTVPA